MTVRTWVTISPDEDDLLIPSHLIEDLVDCLWSEMLLHQNSDPHANPKFALPEGWSLSGTCRYGRYPRFTFEVEEASSAKHAPRVEKILVELMNDWIHKNPARMVC